MTTGEQGFLKLPTSATHSGWLDNNELQAFPRIISFPAHIFTDFSDVLDGFTQLV